MTAWVTYIIYASACGLAILAAIRGLKTHRPAKLICHLIIIVLAVGLFQVIFHPRFDLVPKGANKPGLGLLAAMFVSLVLGMLAQYLYHRFSQPSNRRPPFDLGAFIAPVFASPLVFGPILMAFQRATFDQGDRSIANLSLLLIAFQNGFCWKDFFDNCRNHGPHAQTDHREPRSAETAK